MEKGKYNNGGCQDVQAEVWFPVKWSGSSIPRDYHFDKTTIMANEKENLLCKVLVDKGLLTDSLTLHARYIYQLDKQKQLQKGVVDIKEKFGMNVNLRGRTFKRKRWWWRETERYEDIDSKWWCRYFQGSIYCIMSFNVLSFKIYKMYNYFAKSLGIHISTLRIREAVSIVLRRLWFVTHLQQISV